MPPTTTQLLKLALPLIPQYGFTRTALSRSILQLPPADNSGRPHTEPLSDLAVSALFGNGDNARKMLINAWLDAGIENMSHNIPGKVSVADALHTRLAYNESILAHLPEAFALLSVPEARWSVIPPLDPLPALKHSARIADEACYLSDDSSTRLSWYAQRATLMGVYGAAELHQLTSPSSAHAFLDELLSGAKHIESYISEVGQFSDYVLRSWVGIARSRGIIS
ncbi:Ubiquinone biosynthesis protein [Mycena indigotica]|uniref:Ubiquinone biosynthesis protein n=1 Tax=Mycena indigotica TaxID=2126181 RepID=A0A8H6TAU0_9AGAR|nr:Ubiquinone biosynthesis protein [Mycena indigotica]KAF7312475.1 Ubiquinone biosynthesis protein [Mycena indigotica]